MSRTEEIYNSLAAMSTEQLIVHLGGDGVSADSFEIGKEVLRNRGVDVQELLQSVIRRRDAQRQSEEKAQDHFWDKVGSNWIVKVALIIAVILPLKNCYLHPSTERSVVPNKSEQKFSPQSQREFSHPSSSGSYMSLL